MKSIYSLLLLLPPGALAFSSIPVNPTYQPPPHDTTSNDNADKSRPTTTTSAMPTTTTTSSSSSSSSSSPWRIALDIGREPLARMPFEWARSGCRMPLVIPTDFCSNSNTNTNELVPHSDTVGFTGPDGAVVRPIAGKTWELSGDERTLSFSYVVDEELKRRDVSIEAGTELVVEGRVYTQTEMDRLNDEYYRAREELWEVGGELGDIYDRQSASKKWDEGSGTWVKRYQDENPFVVAQKQLLYWGAKAKQERRMSQRPDLNEVSDRGMFPGVEGGVYVAKGGVVRAGWNGPVCGTWSAMPITGAPASYRS